jgi:cytochrome c peroxidase
MFRFTQPLLLLAGVVVTFAFGISFSQPSPGKALDEPISPIPSATGLDAKKVRLGRRLFEDRRLSKSGRVACVDCHPTTALGTDRSIRPLGGARDGVVKTPTIFNVALNSMHYWDGRAKTLEEQIEIAFRNPVELASSLEHALSTLKGDAQYVAVFTESYPGGITKTALKDALVTYERSLVTPDSRFDRYLRGEPKAITEEEKEGYRLFKKYCVTCHHGHNLGGNKYQTFGAYKDFYGDARPASRFDLGLFNLTRNKYDRHKFRVPSLRLAVLTAPYLHDGSSQTLEGTLAAIAEYQIGKTIDAIERARIIQFLKTLPGRYEGRALE